MHENKAGHINHRGFSMYNHNNYKKLTKLMQHIWSTNPILTIELTDG